MEKVFNVEDVKSSTYYFHMKTTILADFQICISVPLKQIANRINGYRNGQNSRFYHNQWY